MKKLLIVGLLIAPVIASAGVADNTWNPIKQNIGRDFLSHMCPTPTMAPEIDPASAMGGLTLLLGGLTVLRGRRKA